MPIALLSHYNENDTFVLFLFANRRDFQVNLLTNIVHFRHATSRDFWVEVVTHRDEYLLLKVTS